MKKEEKRGQITIFIIVAIIVIVLGILIYFLWPKIPIIPVITENPQSFMDDCMRERVEEVVDIVSLQGGSVNLGNYFLYNASKVEYLCYSSEYYEQCVIQQPVLKDHVEKEIENVIKSKAEECLSDLKKNYEGKGYAVSLGKGMNVELLPKKILINFEGLSLIKTGSKKYDNIRVILNNNLYELISITNSILNSEARYGDAETTVYMTYYPWLRVEKLKQTDGTTVYILTDREGKGKFQFASRSVAWPPGYGV